MESNYPSVKTVMARLVTDKPVRKTPYQVKGVFMRQYPDLEVIPLLDGRYRERFLYPRVQVKILNEQIYIIGIGEGADPVQELIEQFEFLDFGNITFQVVDVDVESYTDHFRPIHRLIRYRFITPWVALNQTTGSRYRFLNNVERVGFLNRLLGQNIVFLAREMGLELTDQVFTKVNLTSLFPRPVDENNWGAFSGEFRTNFILPNYLGLGNGITRGYGAIYGLFNPERFHFDEEALKEQSTELPEDEEALAESDLESVGMEDVPPPRKREITPKKGKPKPKRSRKVLSEEFDIEQDEFMGSKLEGFTPVEPKRKRAPRRKRNFDTIDESRFNTKEYHKKQHEI